MELDNVDDFTVVVGEGVHGGDGGEEYPDDVADGFQRAEVDKVEEGDGALLVVEDRRDEVETERVQNDCDHVEKDEKVHSGKRHLPVRLSA